MTVEEFVPLYIKRHCEAEGLNMDGLRHRMDAIQRRFGAEPLMSLELPGPIEDFKADLKAKGLAAASINRYLAQLRHMINWAIRAVSTTLRQPDSAFTVATPCWRRA